VRHPTPSRHPPHRLVEPDDAVQVGEHDQDRQLDSGIKLEAAGL
jgi:hypothetical protein